MRARPIPLGGILAAMFAGTLLAAAAVAYVTESLLFGAAVLLLMLSGDLVAVLAINKARLRPGGQGRLQ